jgi:hypothetical protein
MTVSPRSGLYYVIPSQIFEDQNLNHTEIVFYALLSGLAEHDGYCFASNKYFSEKMRKGTEQIERYLKKLEDLGYIQRASVRKGTLWDRKIFICNSFKNKTNINSSGGEATMPQPRGIDASPMRHEYIGLISKAIESEERESPLPQRPSQVTFEVSKEAKELSQSLWENIQKRNPTAKPPKLEKWVLEIDKMNRIDKRSWSDISEAINWIFEKDTFWCKVVGSADNLRKNYDKIRLQMTPVNNSQAIYEKNRAMAHEAKSVLKNNETKWKSFYISDNEVIKTDTKESVSLRIPTKEFQLRIAQLFGLRIV